DHERERTDTKRVARSELDGIAAVVHGSGDQRTVRRAEVLHGRRWSRPERGVTPRQAAVIDVHVAILAAADHDRATTRQLVTRELTLAGDKQEIGVGPMRVRIARGR